jgi:hypothetical protein
VRALSSEIFLRIYDIEGALGSFLCIVPVLLKQFIIYKLFEKNTLKVLFLGITIGFDLSNRNIFL